MKFNYLQNPKLLSLLLLTFTFGFLKAQPGPTGGPDAFGYTYITSDTAGGPAYNWIEISTTGTRLVTASTNDDSHEYFTMVDFTFPFYGNFYHKIAVGTNGPIYFEDAYLGLSNVCIPGTPSYTPDRFIAPNWDDLNPSAGGDIYYQEFGNYMVVQFEGVYRYGQTNPDTWQAILYSDGRIKMQYKETDYTVTNTSKSIGIQDSPTLGLQYSCNTSGDVHDSLAILWSPACIISNPMPLADTGVCPGDSALFMADVTGATNYWWNYGDSTSANQVVPAPFTLVHVAWDTANCIYVDTAMVTEYTVGTVNIGADTTVCEGYTLDAGSAWATFMWSDSSAGQTLMPTTSGTYWVMATDSNGCSDSDSANLVVNMNPTVDLGTDTTICAGDSACFDAGAGYSYLWSDASTGQVACFGSSSSISVMITDSAGCMANDSVNLDVIPLVSASYTMDTALCPIVSFTNGSGNANSYAWDFGDGDTDTSANPTHTYASNGTYTVTLVSTNDCGSDTTSMTFDINCLVGVGAPMEGDIRVFPNPTQGQMVMELNGLLDNELMVSLTDLQGREMNTWKLEGSFDNYRKELNLGNVPAGVYFLNVKSENWVRQFKVVRQ